MKACNEFRFTKARARKVAVEGRATGVAAVDLAMAAGRVGVHGGKTLLNGGLLPVSAVNDILTGLLALAGRKAGEAVLSRAADALEDSPQEG